MTLDNKVNKHFEPDEYKAIFSRFKRQEPLMYGIMGSYIKDYCMGSVQVSEVYTQLGRMQPDEKLKQAYINVIESLRGNYGTTRCD